MIVFHVFPPFFFKLFSDSSILNALLILPISKIVEMLMDSGFCCVLLKSQSKACIESQKEKYCAPYYMCPNITCFIMTHEKRPQNTAKRVKVDSVPFSNKLIILKELRGLFKRSDERFSFISCFFLSSRCLLLFSRDLLLI